MGLQEIIMRDIAAKVLRKAADDMEATEGEFDKEVALEWLRERAERLERR